MQEGFKYFQQIWREWWIMFLIITLFLCLVAYRYTHSLPSMPDFFIAYYPAGRLIIENPNNLYQITHSLPNTNDNILSAFINLPIVAYLFTPFSHLNENYAGILFTFLGIVPTFLSSIILTNYTRLKAWKKLLFFGVMLLNVPVSNSIWLGNTTHFIFLPVIASFLCLSAKRDVWSGVLLAVAALIKLPLLFLAVFFVVRQRWGALLGFCLTLLGVVTLSVALCGWNLNLIWFQQCILVFSGKVVGAYNVQSIDSFLVRLLTTAPLDSWNMYEASWQLKLFRYSLFLLFIGGAFWTLFKAKYSTTYESKSLEFSIFLCIAIISSPISWSHYYMLLFLPVSVLISLPWITLKKWTWSAPIALVILLISTPPVKSVSVSNPLVADFVRNFLVSHYFWGGVLLLSILFIARWNCSQMVLEQQNN